MSPDAYLLVALALFSIGLYGLVQRRSLVAMLISLELMLAAVALNVVSLTTRGRSVAAGADAAVGQVVVLILIGVAAAEAAVALSLFVAIQRAARSIDVEDLKDLKG